MFRAILSSIGLTLNAGPPLSTSNMEITPEYRCPHCPSTFRESARFLNHVTHHHQSAPVPALYTPVSLNLEDPDINDLEFCKVCTYLSHTP